MRKPLSSALPSDEIVGNRDFPVCRRVTECRFEVVSRLPRKIGQRAIGSKEPVRRNKTAGPSNNHDDEDETLLLSSRRCLSSKLINSAVITRVPIVLRDDRGARVVVRCLINHPNELLPGPGNLPPKLSLHPPHESMNHSRATLFLPFLPFPSLFLLFLSSQTLCTNVYRLVTQPTKKEEMTGGKKKEQMRKEGNERKKRKI